MRVLPESSWTDLKDPGSWRCQKSKNEKLTYCGYCVNMCHELQLQAVVAALGAVMPTSSWEAGMGFS